MDAVRFDADSCRLAHRDSSGLLQDCFRQVTLFKGTLDTVNLVGGLQGSL